MKIAVFIRWLLSAGGIGWLGFRLLSILDTDWPWFHSLRFDWKRRLSFVIVAVVGLFLGAGVILLAGWLQIMPYPASPQAWVAALFEIAAGAVLYSQDRHASQQARQC